MSDPRRVAFHQATAATSPTADLLAACATSGTREVLVAAAATGATRILLDLHGLAGVTVAGDPAALRAAARRTASTRSATKEVTIP